MKRSFSVLAIAVSILAPAVAQAQEPVAPPPPAAAPMPAPEREEGFGKAGVINVASDLTLSIEHRSYSAPSSAPSPGSTTAYAIGPAADYFVIDNLSVGGQLLFAHSSVGTPSGASAAVSSFRIAPRIGYHVSLVPGQLGLWPRLELGYESGTISSTGSPDVTDKKMVVGVFVPLLIHPVEHFHIGIGPFLDTDLSSKYDANDSTKTTTLGLRTEIGGWWGL